MFFPASEALQLPFVLRNLSLCFLAVVDTRSKAKGQLQLSHLVEVGL